MSISPIGAQDKDKRMKLSVTATTAVAVAGAFAHIAKKQGFSLSPSVIKKTPIKDWAIFSIYDKKNPLKKEVVLEGKEILELATASVAGGLAGGLVFDDKKYRKSKLREALNQLLGNVIVPVTCVWGISEVYKKNKNSIMKIVPQLKEKGKFSKYFNQSMRAIPFSIATLGALTIGIFAGNRVSNFINEKIYHKKVDRNVKATDFAPHVDDIGMAVSMMAEKSKGASIIQRIIPAFLCVPGYQTGTHRD
ncbi:hypothetical protein J6P92_01920 [bacterium]|nr:hypothetical protein [bacterium]